MNSFEQIIVQLAEDGTKRKRGGGGTVGTCW
jgi:hypothetical protein